jgi:hypothetical protein
MSDFNIHKWFKNQYLEENDDPKTGAELEAGMFGTGVAENLDIYTALNTAIPENTSYSDFAKAVAKMLREEYGSHNFTPFMEVLHAELGINESLNEYGKFENQENKLAKEIDDLFEGNPYVTMGEYASANGGGYGTVSFRMRNEFSDSTWNKIIDFVKSKGFEITSDSNYYDIEPGEREWFPRIDFKFNTSSI